MSAWLPPPPPSLSLSLWNNTSKIHSLCRQQEKLKKTMNVSGYEEKVPIHIQEENAAKLAKLIQDFEFFQKETSRLEAEMTDKDGVCLGISCS